MRQLGTLPGLQQREDKHADEGPDELRDRGVDVQDPKVEARELALGAVVVFLGDGALFETGGCGCCGGEGRGEFERGAGRETPVGRDGRAQPVDLHAHEGGGGPGGEG